MPTDAFTLLGLPPRASLDEETLQSAYHQATLLAHPDQAGGNAQLSAELNAALETLKSPVTRLKHLLEHHSDTPWRAVPLDGPLMNLFEQLSPLIQSTQAFLKKKQASTTALSRALLSSEEMRLREALEDLGLKIQESRQVHEAQLADFDQRILQHDASVWAEIQSAQARLAYLSKWRAQVRELLLGLML